MAATPVERRTYGNWRRTRGMGIGNLSGGQSIALFLALLVPVLCMYLATPRIALITASASVVVLAAVLLRFEGQTLADVLTRRARFRRASTTGWLELSGGVMADYPRRADLPGPMAPVVPLSTDDGMGGRQGLLWNRRTGEVTTVIRVSPVGLALADREQTDQAVASYGGLLADLGYEAMVKHVAITIDTAPAGGAPLRDYIASRLDPRAPAAARAIMTELAEVTPAQVADVDTRVSITFDPARATPRPVDLLAAVGEVTHQLPGIEARLSTVGVTVLGRASASWITGRLRMAYDPASRAETPRDDMEMEFFADPEQELLRWAEAGPLRATEAWNHWRHDSGLSVSWALQEAPRQAVAEHVLVPLLAPGKFPRRVTLHYVPLRADAAAASVERELSNTQVRRMFAQRTRRDETQRDRVDFAQALQAAREEADGAGVGSFCIYVTTTVLDEADLPAAVADVEQRAGQCKIRLRRMWGAQSAAFAAALGMGINPIELAHRSAR